MPETVWARRPLQTVVTLLIALVVLGVILAFIQWVVGGAVMPFDGSMMRGAMSALGMLLMVLFGLAVAGLVFWAIFALSPLAKGEGWGGPHDWASMAAVSDLKKRYANGLVSREDYLRLLADIERPATPAPAPGAPAAASPAGAPSAPGMPVAMEK